jgi:hypothetical protein
MNEEYKEEHSYEYNKSKQDYINHMYYHNNNSHNNNAINTSRSSINNVFIL